MYSYNGERRTTVLSDIGMANVTDGQFPLKRIKMVRFLESLISTIPGAHEGQRPEGASNYA